MTSPPVWLLAAMPLLGGCLTASDVPTQKVAAPTRAQEARRPTKTLKAKITAAVPRSAKPTYSSVETLNGETSERVTTLLGMPDFRRTDQPAELWQYRHDKCSLDLFLYPRAGGGLSVNFLDVRAYGDQNLSLQACFVAILEAKADTGGRG